MGKRLNKREEHRTFRRDRGDNEVFRVAARGKGKRTEGVSEKRQGPGQGVRSKGEERDERSERQ